MGSEWKPIGEMLSSIIDYRGRTPPKSESGIPCISAANVKNGRIDLSSTSYVSQATYNSWTTRGFPKPGDVVITTEAPVGEIALFPGDQTYLLTRRVMALQPNPKLLDNKFLLYALQTPAIRDQLFAVVRGTTVQRVLKTDITGLKIPTLPLPEQKAIAHILGCLDDKIELNRRMNASLEGMAQALFQSWFVDFDPVIDNALAAGNPIPDELAERAETRSQALADGTANREAAQAFPAAFQRSEELGWIPEGWEVGPITDLADLNPESWSTRNHPNQIRYVDLSNTKDGRINDISQYEYADAPSRARRVLREDDTIIGTVRPGNRSFAYIHEGGLTGSTGFAVLHPKRMSSRVFIYLCLTQEKVIENFAHLADGAAYPAIRPEVVGNHLIPIVSSKLMDIFDRQCYPLIQKIGEHQRQAETLTALRDTLLPKLISGDLRIPDGAALAEEALA